jgi:phosphomannomutase
MSIAPDLAATVRAWIAIDPDPETRAELEGMLARGEGDRLAERFAGRVAFGTAGLRSGMYGGPTGMCRLVVRQAAAGIARHLLADIADARTRGVVVTYDARHRSDVFARDAAEVVAAHGIPVTLGDHPLPTPVGVFAVRHLGAAAAIVITASHNPASDNGMKLFMGDGAQIAPPTDAAVAACIDAVVADGVIVPLGEAAPVVPLQPDVIEAYRSAVLARVPSPAIQIPIAMSAMHGVGGALLLDLLRAAGYDTVTVVREQQDPDPDFPTVSFPNPEEAGATDLLAAQMVRDGAVLGLAVDPDADRVAVCTMDGDHPRQLTGDEVGALLGEWLLAEVTAGDDRLVVTTVVSSSRLQKIAARHSAHFELTLTGFKWLARAALGAPNLRQVLAYEEAIGYAVGPDVFDKDGIGAALAVASMTAGYAARGLTLAGVLDDLDRTYGAHVTANFSLRYEGIGWRERRDATVARLVSAPPTHIGQSAVERVELLAPDVLRIELGDGVRVLIRPSGTEPKLKCYCEAVEAVVDGDVAAARARATERLVTLRAALEAMLS